MKKRYSFRAYPTPGQEIALARLFGCVRVVYNDFVAAKQLDWQKNRALQKSDRQWRSDGDIAKSVTTLAKRTPERAWLASVSSVPLQQAVRDARSAYQNFFDSVTGKRRSRKVGAPKFRRKQSRQAARFVGKVFTVRTTTHGVGKVKLPKIGWVRFALSRELPTPSSVTIIRNPDGIYEVSFVVETVGRTTPTSKRTIGIDLGLTDFAAIVGDDGIREKVANPRHLRRVERKLAHAQKVLARKHGPARSKGLRPSQNYQKQQLKVAQAYSGVRRSRADFQHKLAHRLVIENQVIAVEKLNVLGLARAGAKGSRGRCLRRSVSDASWGNFLRILGEKCLEFGRELVPVNPAYTSQACSLCGVIDGPKPLSVREWRCSVCSANLDRDYNAAVNILVAGGHSETINACGEDVRRKLASVCYADLSEPGTRRSELIAAQRRRSIAVGIPVLQGGEDVNVTAFNYRYPVEG